LADAKKVKAFYTILQTDITENIGINFDFTLNTKQLKEVEKKEKIM